MLTTFFPQTTFKGRSIVDMEIDTMVELSNEKNIIGVKDATNDLMRPLLTRVSINREFKYLFKRF